MCGHTGDVSVLLKEQRPVWVQVASRLELCLSERREKIRGRLCRLCGVGLGLLRVGSGVSGACPREAWKGTEPEAGACVILRWLCREPGTDLPC